MQEKSDAPLIKSRYWVLAAMMLGNIMGPIDASIVNVVLPTITQYFRVGIATAQWVPMIYLLTISSLLLFYGRLGDILGYKKIYLWGLAGFIIASGLCGLSPSIHWLIFARALQGLAAGMMMAVPFAVITALFPPTERGKALGINAISISIGLAIGPSLGGMVTFLASWHFVFLINVPIGLAGLLWAQRMLPELKGQHGKVDIPGVVAVFIFLFTLLLFVNRCQSLGLDFINKVLLLVTVLSGFCFFCMSRLTAAADTFDIVWRLVLFGLGTGVFQSPNSSAVMGSVPRPHLGIASGILATMRNVGMVFGIAVAGAVLYAVTPSYIFQKAVLDGSEAAVFLTGLRYAYLSGVALSVSAGITSCIRRMDKNNHR